MQSGASKTRPPSSGIKTYCEWSQKVLNSGILSFECLTKAFHVESEGSTIVDVMPADCR